MAVVIEESGMKFGEYEEENVLQEAEPTDSKAMEKALKDKKIVIIGGHSN